MPMRLKLLHIISIQDDHVAEDLLAATTVFCIRSQGNMNRLDKSLEMRTWMKVKIGSLWDTGFL